MTHPNIPSDKNDHNGKNITFKSERLINGYLINDGDLGLGKLLKEHLSITLNISPTLSLFSMTGPIENLQSAHDILEQLDKKAEKGNTINESDIYHVVQNVLRLENKADLIQNSVKTAKNDNKKNDNKKDITPPPASIKSKRKRNNQHSKGGLQKSFPATPRTGQRHYIRINDYKFSPLNDEQAEMYNQLSKVDLLFALGPAGTGKTHIAVAKAVEAYEQGRVSRIILSRPAVEAAGEKIGFMPGTKEEKVAPYMQPLYDELDKIIGRETRVKLMEIGDIEITPLSFLRGRTLEDAFIILDEAQNTSPEQMKMVLSRAGLNSKISVTGDPDQHDLPKGQISGLVDAVERFKDIEQVSVIALDKIVRSPLAQLVVEAYEDKPKPKYQPQDKPVQSRNTGNNISFRPKLS